jgi:phosphopantetheinyl transferase (holo-ACP synthase)
MLGNDVVDLEDVDARPETFHQRFERRVFADEERRVIAEDEDPQACRWAHWGAKEAAYKLARQLDPSFVFSPARLVVHFEPRISREDRDAPGLDTSIDAVGQRERRGRLTLFAGPRETATYVELRSFETGEFVHVVALPAGADWGAVSMAVDTLGEGAEDPSLAVRRLALRTIAHELGVDFARLSIGRRGRIPTVELDGRTTELSLSLSHHGRFVAFAFRLAFALAPRGRGMGGMRGEGTGTGADREQEESDREEQVTQSAGAVGYPVGVADTEWMAG